MLLPEGVSSPSNLSVRIQLGLANFYVRRCGVLIRISGQTDFFQFVFIRTGLSVKLFNHFNLLKDEFHAQKLMIAAPVL